MSDTSNILPPKRRDTRWPVMPAPNNMLPMPSQPRPSDREHFRPRNGPPIEEWEAALIGRQLIKEDAADMVSDKSLHATLKICSQKAHGALGRLPIEVILLIEHLIHSSVSGFINFATPPRFCRMDFGYILTAKTFKKSDLPRLHKLQLSGACNAIIGRSAMRLFLVGPS